MNKMDFLQNAIANLDRIKDEQAETISALEQQVAELKRKAQGADVHRVRVEQLQSEVTQLTRHNNQYKQQVVKLKTGKQILIEKLEQVRAITDILPFLPSVETDTHDSAG